MIDAARLRRVADRLPLAAFVFLAALAASVPTLGDLGLTWDEPAYRYSQVVSAQWWERLFAARTTDEVSALFSADALLYYWPYARHGINFHPPLAGQLNQLTYALTGGWLKDVPARRLASSVEFALAIAILFQFVGRRYGYLAGLTAAGALLTMPRVYGDAHVFGTDIPGLLIWPATAIAAWKGLNEPGSGWYRVAFGVLLGLGFLTKMAAVAVILPIGLWIIAARPPALIRRGTRLDWLDGLLTLGPMLAVLGLSFVEIRRLADLLPEPGFTDLFHNRPPSRLPGLVLFAPLMWWLARRGLARWRRATAFWGTERPALELIAAALAIPPAVAVLGCPPWWRETFTRLAHYYLLNTNRSGSLPDIRIAYWGDTYLYCLPWHNAWVLTAITVPLALIGLALVGIGRGVWTIRSDGLPTYLLLHFATLPVLRMLPTPAHDGVRLFLPTFWFLAAFAGLGVGWVGSGLARLFREPGQAPLFGAGIGLMAVALSAIELRDIHPYELSYYNQSVGGPAGAWRRGFELSYWYDAFNGPTLREIESKPLPDGAALTPPNADEDVPTFVELQALGELRADIDLGGDPAGAFPFKWLLTHDSKANPYSRLLFAMRPWYSSEPEQLDGARVASIAAPDQAALAWALQLITDASTMAKPYDPPAPAWIERNAPALRRFWGAGLPRPRPPAVREDAFAWAREDPEGLVAAARRIAGAGSLAELEAEAGPARLLRIIDSNFDRRFLTYLLARDPRALERAAEILASRPETVRHVLLRPGYMPPGEVGGPLDQLGSSVMELAP